MEFFMKEVGFKTTFEYGELHVAGDEAYGFRPFQLMSPQSPFAAEGF